MNRFLSLFLSLCVVSACSSRIEHARVSQQPAANNTININTAPVTDLERLPYIGRTTAEAIVAHRDQHGAFRRPEEVMLIRGVSERRYHEIRHLITTR